MKYFYPLVLLLFFSCKDNIKNEIAIEKPLEKVNFGTPDITPNKKITTKADLLGYWVGSFDVDFSNDEIKRIIEKDTTDDYMSLYKKITFSVDKINESTIEGHSVVGGNISTFKGELNKAKNAFNIIVNETEKKKTDGKFVLKINIGDSTLTGNWFANNKIAVPLYAKKLQLYKKFFKYNPDSKLNDRYSDYTKHKTVEKTYEEEDSIGNIRIRKYEDNAIFTTTRAVDSINPSKILLTKEVVENLSKGDIYIMRNLIFARHGFSFREKRLRSFFDDQDWYMPVFSDVKKNLTEIEKKNIDLLLRYEQNAKEYYDVFGR